MAHYGTRLTIFAFLSRSRRRLARASCRSIRQSIVCAGSESSWKRTRLREARRRHARWRAMEVRQGDVVWVSPDRSNGMASDHMHPYVVISDGSLETVVLCGLTSNLKRAKEPGHVLLEEGEANLPRQSVVVVSRMST